MGHSGQEKWAEEIAAGEMQLRSLVGLEKHRLFQSWVLCARALARAHMDHPQNWYAEEALWCTPDDVFSWMAWLPPHKCQGGTKLRACHIRAPVGAAQPTSPFGQRCQTKLLAAGSTHIRARLQSVTSDSMERM
eukprot:5967171-Amphidinium_carterae.1